MQSHFTVISAVFWRFCRGKTVIFRPLRFTDLLGPRGDVDEAPNGASSPQRVPGARGDLGLAARRRFQGELGATLCPPKICTLSFVRVRVCSELQLRVRSVVGALRACGAPSGLWAPIRSGAGVDRP